METNKIWSYKINFNKKVLYSLLQEKSFKFSFKLIINLWSIATENSLSYFSPTCIKHLFVLILNLGLKFKELEKISTHVHQIRNDLLLYRPTDLNWIHIQQFSTNVWKKTSKTLNSIITMEKLIKKLVGEILSYFKVVLVLLSVWFVLKV